MANPAYRQYCVMAHRSGVGYDHVGSIFAQRCVFGVLKGDLPERWTYQFFDSEGVLIASLAAIHGLIVTGAPIERLDQGEGAPGGDRS